jgi:hypothetical protein
MLSNRHVAAALIVLPILSLSGWWAAGVLTGEQPQPAQQGITYPLVEQSGCRYAGGACALDNVDVNLALAYADGGLELRSSLPMEGVLMAIGPPGDDRTPLAMKRGDGHGRYWRLALRDRPAPGYRIRLAARARGITWFGEAGTAFLHPEDDGPADQ